MGPTNPLLGSKANMWALTLLDIVKYDWCKDSLGYQEWGSRTVLADFLGLLCVPQY